MSRKVLTNSSGVSLIVLYAEIKSGLLSFITAFVILGYCCKIQNRIAPPPTKGSK